MESSLTTKGQATIPRAVRERLRLKAGDKVRFFIHPNGTAVILPKLPASKVKGFLSGLSRPVAVEEMNEGIAEAATDRFRRSR